MATTEHTINDALADLLRGTRRAWRDTDIVSSENTGQLKGSSARPDILVVEPNVSPVVIETEVVPAVTVESEAVDRLGKQLKKTGRRILSSVAVRLPLRLRDKASNALKKELASATDLEMVLYTGSNPAKATRWPQSGWMVGSVTNLSLVTQSATVPPDVIDEAVTNLVNGVGEAAGMLAEIANENSGAVHKISKELFQEDGVQTRRMATTILANAFVFHENLAGKLTGVNSIDELRGKKNFNKASVLNEWDKILKVNYWPIFDIARRILEHIPVGQSKALIQRLAETADSLLENRLMRSHDLTGAVFQRMIVDRKFLAAYYTTPASAALLIGLAVTPQNTPAGAEWGKPENITALRIADFACGTGTLLTTAYQRIGQLHELAGGDSEAIHAEMMAHSIVGCDVLPAAAHLTASMVSGAHPIVKYNQSLIMTVPYGKMPEGGVALGSLELLDPQAVFEPLAITAKAAEGMGEKERETWSALPHRSFDLVVMNPPLTRSTDHGSSKHNNVPNPMFAAFSSTTEEQRMMAEATKRLTAGTSAHGNAGEASIFLVLADRKIKNGGRLALVMPLSLMMGEPWEDSRTLLTKNYCDLILVSIAGTTDIDSSFSADTGMAECLVMGRKYKPENKRATFVVLKERPPYPLLGLSAAEQIHRLIAGKSMRALEDGPVGGTHLYFGDEIIGQAMNAPLPDSGGWNLARIADLSLAQAAYQLADKQQVWLPGMDKAQAINIPITTVEVVGKIGPHHRDINGKTPEGIRGPFEIREVKGNEVPTYPVLWAHDAKREQVMCFDGDSEGLPLKGATIEQQESIDEKIASIWATASKCHCNLDFRFNSQSTAMQFTPRRTIGGRAWRAIQASSDQQEKALVVWANTSLGLLLRWWHSNKQQSGRGNLSKSTLQTLPVLDVPTLAPPKFEAAVKIFDEMCHKQLLPIHEIDKDATRKELDERFGREVLGLPESILAPGGALEVLRMKLAQEPSIRGNK